MQQLKFETFFYSCDILVIYLGFGII